MHERRSMRGVCVCVYDCHRAQCQYGMYEVGCASSTRVYIQYLFSTADVSACHSLHAFMLPRSDCALTQRCKYMASCQGAS